MKSFKLLIIGLLATYALFLNACTNSSSASVQTDSSTEVYVESVEETSVEETSTEKIDEQDVNIEESEAKDSSMEESNVQNDNIEETNAFEDDVKEGSNVLVAYFSATGTTKRVAEKIAELEASDIYEIVPKVSYSDADLNWNDSNSRSTKEMDDPSVRPEIGSPDIDLTKYSIIYLGYPIWWGDAPRIMSTFVEKYNFAGKKVIPFCTSGGSGIGRSGSNLASLAGSGDFARGERLNSSADTSSIQSFINSNK
ncbi:MAG: flavodoxin [Lachnospiraceae bacterium]|nr:flavodoxin [Lachnospiraceae bacterium]